MATTLLAVIVSLSGVVDCDTITAMLKGELLYDLALFVVLPYGGSGNVIVVSNRR